MQNLEPIGHEVEITSFDVLNKLDAEPVCRVLNFSEYRSAKADLEKRERQLVKRTKQNPRGVDLTELPMETQKDVFDVRRRLRELEKSASASYMKEMMICYYMVAAQHVHRVKKEDVELMPYIFDFEDLHLTFGEKAALINVAPNIDQLPLVIDSLEERFAPEQIAEIDRIVLTQLGTRLDKHAKF